MQDPTDFKDTRRLTLPLREAHSDMLVLVGGKALNLGELLRADFPVPDGFCITTNAYQLVSEQTAVAGIIAQIAGVEPQQTDLLSQYAAAARSELARAEIPAPVNDAIRDAYSQLTPDGLLPVAVRSSATAEDLPFASFAGQQDTYLNVVGFEAVMEAVQRCWASLWTERAVSYRAMQRIDPYTVRLAVVVQHMVDAVAAGVMFTANPITGRRSQAVIDASVGLGEAVVSGAVNPDHFIVDLPEGRIVERHLGDKRISIRSIAGGGTQREEQADSASRFALDDDQVIALAKLGMRVEQHYGTPQDTEWAVDALGKLWLTQTRPITTLYPLPESAPANDDSLRVYFSVNVAQGVFQPFTPMGIATLRLMFASGTALFSKPLPDPIAGPRFLVDAAERLFFDMTPIMRSPIGQPILLRAMGQMEARSGVVFKHLMSDPRLTPIHTSRWRTVRSLLPFFWRVRSAPLRLLEAASNPAAARKRIARLQERIQALSRLPEGISASERITYFESLFVDQTAGLMVNIIPILWVVFGLPALLKRVLGDQATDAERQAVLRAVPHNPTTEMDHALWMLAQEVRQDASAAAYVGERTPEQLSHQYQRGELPLVLQQGLAVFLQQYGHRAIAEIDLGLPRWSDDPTHPLGAISNFLQVSDPESGADRQFKRAADQAEMMAVELTRRARERSWLHGKLAAFCVSRMRALAGLREVPKYNFILLMAQGRRILSPVGEELVRMGRLDAAEDIFFLNTRQVRQALDGDDLREIVRKQRAIYEQELKRRHIPRILLSDGTEPEMSSASGGGTDQAANTLWGTPASAGVIAGKARVILNPQGAKLEPGEILVAPSTDPGWTPLFLTAGGLVMEMGGPMSHGAVVAREYGIPAVVGVAQATTTIQTGQLIRVDGSSGKITAESDQRQKQSDSEPVDHKVPAIRVTEAQGRVENQATED